MASTEGTENMTHADMADRIDTLTNAISLQRALGDHVGADKLNIEMQSIKAWAAQSLAAAGPALMTKTEAAQFRNDRAQRARDLHRMTKAKLAVIAARHTLYDVMSKDELVTACLNARYPLALENEAIHVLHHKDATLWSACELCARTVGAAMTAAEDAR